MRAPGSLLTGLAGLDRSTWVRGIPIALIAGLLIAVPSALLDTPIFGRPIAPRPIDYVVLTVTAGLIGLILAIRPQTSEQSDRQERRTLWSGFASFLAVGCPVCNQAVVALVGTSGALSWWAPIQPMVGVGAVAALIWTLRHRVQTYQLTSCPI